MLRCAPIVLASAILLHAQSPAPGSFDLHVTTTANAPVAGATVSIEGPGGQLHSGVTWADGHFRVANLPPGTYKFVAFDAPGYTRSSNNFLTDVSVQAGQTRAYSFQLVPAPKIEGTVIDENSIPIEGITVVAEPSTPRRDSRSFSAKTNAQGAFSMTLTALPESFLEPGMFGLPSLTVGAQEGRTYYSGEARLVLSPTSITPISFTLRTAGAPNSPPQ